jgi:hypothetical protein
VPPSSHIFVIGREASYILYPLSKAPVGTQKKLHFSWMSSGIVPSPQSCVPVRLLPGTSSCGCFRQTGRWCWCQRLDSHILAFLNSVSLPLRRHKSIYIEVNKLQFMKLSVYVWRHTAATPRGRLLSSQAFRSVTFAYDEGTRWQTTRYVAAKRVVQITVSVLYHILVNGENFTRTVVYFLFGRPLTNILQNGRRCVSKLLILLSGPGLSNSCLPYFN